MRCTHLRKRFLQPRNRRRLADNTRKTVQQNDKCFGNHYSMCKRGTAMRRIERSCIAIDQRTTENHRVREKTTIAIHIGIDASLAQRYKGSGNNLRGTEHLEGSTFL